MTTASANPLQRSPTDAGTPPLHNGDRLSQTEFHRRYLAYPDDVRFELIGGTVYMSSPLKLGHGTFHPELSTWLTLYKSATPGVQVADNTTVVLDDDNEVQPDLLLRILPEKGGQSKTSEDDYVVGPPEWIGEIAHSTVAIDLHAKRDVYRQAGVIEYMVICVHEQEVRWFDLASDRLFTLDADGVINSRVFPGLWLNVSALFSRNTEPLIASLRTGLSDHEHEAFVQRLQTQN